MDKLKCRICSGTFFSKEEFSEFIDQPCASPHLQLAYAPGIIHLYRCAKCNALNAPKIDVLSIEMPYYIERLKALGIYGDKM